MNQAELAKKLKRLEQDNAELMAALRPFVNLVKPFHARADPSKPIFAVEDSVITSKDLLRAQAVYNKHS